MTVWDAWKLLGRDPQIIAGMLQESSLQNKAQIADDTLDTARKLAKKLMAKSHPDVNPDDPNAADKFKQIQDALSVIEVNTEDFKNKVGQAIEKKKNSVVIVVDK
jgi:hypothetical protein